jgi:hypothetical protein
MKSPRPRRFHTIATLAALTLFALACASAAQGSKHAQTQAPKPEASAPAAATPGRNDVGPFRASEVTKEPFVLTMVGQFPFGGGWPDERLSGVVRLRAVFSRDRGVTDVTVLKSPRAELTENALAAADMIIFKPAEKDGRPVSQYVTLEYYFHFFYDGGDNYGGRGQLTKGVKILEQPQPVYTAAQLASGFAGKLLVQAVFGRDGEVLGAKLWRAVDARGEPLNEGVPGGLSERAVEAALRIKFEPAEYEGIQVSVVREVEYDFPPDAPAKH